MKEVYYFGVLRNTGHHLWHPTKFHINPNYIPDFLWSLSDLDGGLLEKIQAFDRYDGRVYWARQQDWFMFLWWDRSGDKRSQSNSGFYVKGFNTNQYVAAFQYASDKFYEIIKRQSINLTLQNLPIILD